MLESYSRSSFPAPIDWSSPKSSNSKLLTISFSSLPWIPQLMLVKRLRIVTRTCLARDYFMVINFLNFNENTIRGEKN